jgi:hypothetical protein
LNLRPLKEINEIGYLMDADGVMPQNIFVVSDISPRKDGQTPFFVDAFIGSIAFILMAMLALTWDIPYWVKIPCGVGVLLLAFNSFLFKSAILNRADKTITINRKLFGLLRITQRIEPLSAFHGVRIRVIPNEYGVRLLVELVGLHGSTLTLKVFQSLNDSSINDDARSLRDSIAEWLNMTVMFDPCYPGYN